MLFKGLDYYDNFKKAFMPVELEPDRDETALTKEIYQTMMRIRTADSRHKEVFLRHVQSESSSFFQDLIALYLKSIYGHKGFKVILEKKHYISKPEKDNPTRTKRVGIMPDIEIRRESDDKAVFAIEVKTTMGWSRPDIEKHCRERIDELKKALSISDKQTAYIFESYNNCGREFRNHFIDANGVPRRPDNFPFTNIFPLFSNSVSPNPNDLIDNSEADYEMPEDMINSRFEEILKLIDEAINNL